MPAKNPATPRIETFADAVAHSRETRTPLKLTPDVKGTFPTEEGPTGRPKTGLQPANLDDLARVPGVQAMIERYGDMVHQAKNMRAPSGRTVFEEGLDFYPHENRQIREIGERFNDARVRTGQKTYFPDQPELAGALLRGQFSQNTPEDRRKHLVEHAASTGEIKGHLATKTINNAIENDVHPIAAASRLKLRDFTGSIVQPHDWAGQFGGEHLGWGYTGDRHHHDILVGERFGAANRGISGGDTDERRYRLIQAVTHLAHQAVDPERIMSVPAFQAVPWGVQRGGTFD